MAYRTSRDILVHEAIREVGITANARKELLLRLLNQQRSRAAALFRTADLSCDNTEIWCLHRLLKDFVATEGASAARLVYPGTAPVTVGEGAAILTIAVPPADDQIAHFGFDQKGQPYYVVQVHSEDGAALITIRGDMESVYRIFLEHYGLGQSAETFLTDARGFSLTPPRYPVDSGKGHPIGGKPMQECLAGMDNEVLDRDYRGVPAIHGFRHISEIGGGCVMALIDQAEAFAATKKVRNQVAGISALLAVLAIGCSFMLAQLVSRPMDRLTVRARSLQAGDFDSPVPISGPAEVQIFARTFQTMANSLKESRTALEESNEQIKNILESISDGFIAVDREWRCTYANGKATELSRVPREELLGNKIWDLLADADNTAIYSKLHRAMNDNAPMHSEEYAAPLGAWFQVDAYPTRSGLAVFGRDVTERKRFSEQLLQTQKLESLGVLAGGIAHDFNNFLTVVQGNIEMAKEKLDPDEPVQAILDQTASACQRAVLLSSQLLTFAKGGVPVRRLVSVGKLVMDAVQLAHAGAQTSIEVSISEDLWFAEVDPGQIGQVLHNILLNARQAMPEGGIVEVHAENVALGDTPQADTRVRISIRDYGCGITADVLAQIFDPYFTTKVGGSGLGLATAYAIIAKHDGNLSVESKPGDGTTFTIELPASQEGPGPQLPIVARMQSGTERLLVMDDEEALSKLLKSVLTKLGYEVETARDGAEAIALVENAKASGRSFDAVLLDLTVRGGMGGAEAAVRLKALDPSLKLIVSSGYSDAPVMSDFRKYGFDDVIPKPWVIAEVSEVFRRVLVPDPNRQSVQRN